VQPAHEPYFDAIVAQDDWEHLYKLLACPHMSGVALLADALPPDFLNTLPYPIDQTLSPQMLPLAEDEQRLLATNQACWELFVSSLESRLKLRQTLLNPGIERLANYARGQTDKQAEQYVKISPVAQAQVALLKRELMSTWVHISNPIHDSPQHRPEQFHDIPEAIVSLVDGCLQNQFAPVRASQSPQPEQAVLKPLKPEATLIQTLQILREEQQVRMTRLAQTLTIGWNRSQAEVWVGAMTGANMLPVQHLRVEIRYGDETIRSTYSDQGRAIIQFSALERALQVGAELVILVAPEENT
jgi:hypothetical protein